MAIDPDETTSLSHHELMTIATAVATGMGVAIDESTGVIGTPYLYSLGETFQLFYEKFCEYKEEQHSDLQAILEKMAGEECCASLAALAEQMLENQEQQITVNQEAAEIAVTFAEESAARQEAYNNSIVYPEKDFYPFTNMPNDAEVIANTSAGCKTYSLPEGTVIQTCDHCTEFNCVMPSGTILTIQTTAVPSLELPDDGPLVPSRTLLIDPAYCLQIDNTSLTHACMFPVSTAKTVTPVEDGYPNGERIIKLVYEGVTLIYYRDQEKIVVTSDSGFFHAEYGLRSATLYESTGDSMTSFQDGTTYKHQCAFIPTVTVFADGSYLFDMRRLWDTQVAFWTCGPALSSQAYAYANNLDLPDNVACQDALDTSSIDESVQLSECEQNTPANPLKGTCDDA